jgi:hypothetical protein
MASGESAASLQLPPWRSAWDKQLCPRQSAFIQAVAEALTTLRRLL